MPWQMDLGSVRVVALEDGFFTPEPDFMFPAWDWGALPEGAADLEPGGTLRIGLGCFLIDSGSRVVLVDSGGGPNEVSPDPFTTGRLPSELAAAGYEPPDVTGIIHTHLHFDHWGGDLDASGGPAFPGATIFLHRDELEWGRGQERVQPFLSLVAEGRVETVDGDVEVFPGIRTVATPGHTPGHLSIALDFGGAQALILGDVSHHPAQLRNPGWNVRFDVDQEQAAATRAGILDRLTDGSEILMGGHWPGPGWGRVVTRDGDRRFEPL